MEEINIREDFQIGEEASLKKKISQQDILKFAEITEDRNPIHLDEHYASRTFFKKRIVHGMLPASLISAVLGTKLPGSGSIYLDQYLKFLKPVYPGDEITAIVRVTDWNNEKRRIKLLTEVINQNQDVVIIGEANLMMASNLKKETQDTNNLHTNS
ncbi:MAG: MaoC family dehydratase [Anaerolineales bacterium]|nr:MaoC family dehydratase [Anaerolineales bacterium]